MKADAERELKQLARKLQEVDTQLTEEQQKLHDREEVIGCLCLIFIAKGTSKSSRRLRQENTRTTGYTTTRNSCTEENKSVI